MGSSESTYTCTDYRQEMMLLGLQNRLRDTTLSDEEVREIQTAIKQLEQAMGL